MSERAARLALSCVVEPATAKVTEQVAQWGAERVWDELRRGSDREPLTRRALLGVGLTLSGVSCMLWVS